MRTRCTRVTTDRRPLGVTKEKEERKEQVGRALVAKSVVGWSLRAGIGPMRKGFP